MLIPTQPRKEFDPLNILIADRDADERGILSSIIEDQGHVALAASSSAEAVEILKSSHPEIVVVDAGLIDAEGSSIISLLKSAAGEEFVPVLTSTSRRDDAFLAECLESGGDDYLVKPYNETLLRAKLNSMIRLRNTHTTVRIQHDELVAHHQHLVREQKVAKAVFDNVLHAGCLNSPNIKYLLSPLALFNGDVLLAAQKPAGGMHIFLGDFTGHGLPAAIGAMPLAEMFYYMSSKGFSISDITAEMNLRLKSILPTGVFCCGCMVDVSYEKQMIQVWSGGIPDCYLVSAESGDIQTIPSRHLPLGILEASEFAADVDVYEMKKGDRLLVCSDGVSEALNAENEMFGDHRVVEVIESTKDKDTLFDRLEKAVHGFIGEQDRDDDLTLVEVKMVREYELSALQPGSLRSKPGGPREWFMEYELGARSLRDFNPLPLLLHIAMEVPGLRPYSGQIYTILAELFSNALEHGVLGLNSQMKASASGFTKYYEQRDSLLSTLDAGTIIIRFRHTPVASGGALVIEITDSGAGFDVASVLRRDHGDAFSGRGISMVRSLCDALDYNEKGNCAEATYIWQFD